MSTSGARVRQAGVMLAVLFLAMVVCIDGWRAIVATSVNPHSSGAGLMAVAAAAYLLWLNRDWLRNSGRGSWTSLALVIGSAALYALGAAWEIDVLVHICTIFFALGMVCCVLHEGSLRALTPVAVALLFAVPLPGIANDLVSVPLQLIDARTVEIIGHAVGLPVARTGTLIAVNGITVDIDRGCDGLRLVWPMLLAAYTAAAVGIAPHWMRLLVCMVAIPAALLLNLFRLAITTYLYGYASPESAALVHDVIGWALVISAGFVPFVILNSVTGSHQKSHPDNHSAVAPCEITRTGLPVRIGAGITAALLAISTGPLESRSLAPLDDEAVRSRIAALPYKVGHWIGEDRQVPLREKEILDADTLVQRVYHRIETDASLLVLVAYHRDGRQASGHNAPRCYRVRGWEVVSEAPTRWTIDGRSVKGTAYVLSRSDSRMTVFEVFSSPTPSTSDGTKRVAANGSQALLRIQFLIGGSQAQSQTFYRTVGRFLSPLVRQGIRTEPSLTT